METQSHRSKGMPLRQRDCQISSASLRNALVFGSDFFAEVLPTMSVFSAQKHHCRVNICLSLLIMLFGFAIPAFSFDAGGDFDHPDMVPAEYGQVIYQKNGHAENQIYIIGQAHRSGIDGGNSASTVQAQMEIYRIGEWLIRQKEVRLLLPEGFFQRRKIHKSSTPEPMHLAETASPDSRYLRARLEDTRKFVNADSLLHEQYPVRLAQVEDEQIYWNVSNLLRELGQQQDEQRHFEKLEDLQKKRTFAMLQNIPSAVEKVFQRGELQRRNAIFTIGMAHLADIIDFLNLHNMSSDEMQKGGAFLSLDLMEEDYGVTVILPRSLADDERGLRLTQLRVLSAEL